RRRHTSFSRDWSSDVCSSDLQRLRVGVALHSLRAVPPDALAAVLQGVAAQALPIHIHIAEQVAEVEDCLAVRGARPVAWLCDHRSEEHTSELQSRENLVCRLL